MASIGGFDEACGGSGDGREIKWTSGSNEDDDG